MPRVLKKCLEIIFYTYIPVNPYNLLTEHDNRCTLLKTCVMKRGSAQTPDEVMDR
jgi:hypothetical protein